MTETAHFIMPHPNPVDWSKVVWNQTTQAIAKSVNRSTNTVSKMRSVYAPDTVGKYLTRTRLFTEESKARQILQASLNGKKNHMKATEAAKLSPISGKGESNQFAKKWLLIAPDGRHFMVVNLHHFVRENPELFNEEDVVWRADGKYCAAVGGLRQAPITKKGEWKGWSVKKYEK